MEIPFFETWPHAIFGLMIAGFFLFFIFNIVRRGGLKAAMFDAKIESTVGDVATTAPALMSQKLKVHVLEKNGEKMLGIEIVSKSAMSYHMLPIVLSQTQARALASLLREGTRES
jgi:hypothetical protein